MGLMGIVDKYFIKKPRLRKFLTRWYYGDKNQLVSVSSARLYINSIKENGYLRASRYAHKSSVFRDEIPVLITLASFIGNDAAFIDVGANVGLYSSTFKKFIGFCKNFRIYAFEANPDTFKRLQKTVENSGIEVFNIALSHQEGSLEFVEGVVSHVFAERSHSNRYHPKNARLSTISSKRLDQFDIIGASLIIKIDVEGHEYEVLLGSTGFFQSNRVQVVYIDGCSRKDEIVSFLKDYGFECFDAKTLKPFQMHDFSLLAIKKKASV